MKLPHESFKMPSDDTVIWRYMDVTKFLSLILKRELYFPALPQLEDPYEGVHPTLGSFAQSLHDEFLQGLLTNGPDAVATSLGDMARKKGVSDAELADTMNNLRSISPEMIERLTHNTAETGNIEYLCNMLQRAYRSMFVASCWHMNDGQSAAMWKAYTNSGQGIAIKSNIGRVKLAIGDASDNCFAAEVEYYSSSPRMNALGSSLCFQKRASFAYEHEVRFVLRKEDAIEWSEVHACAASLPKATPLRELTDHFQKAMIKPPITGQSLPVSLNDLIDEVYIAPTCDHWTREALDLLLANIDLNKAVIQSDLYKDPLAMI